MKTDLVYDDYKQYEIELSEDIKLYIPKNTFIHRFKFENYYGASVIKHWSSCGYDEDLFELAVLKFDEFGVHLCYTTPITDDVIGYLNNDEVLALLERIKGL